ncbi:PAS domain-containing protein [uncultured Dokdonia sp.]|uniref:PAS domain-containing protein n=1 Tax=uncultured Dokdonia sp. TaxID=575653 RepID=UPI0026232A71|nr:PAS domain-containing protein [uncultured Dokdonia sp.]
MKYSRDKVAIIITNVDQTIIWVNEVFTQMTGYNFMEVRGKKPSILQGKNTEKAALNRIRKSLKEEKSFHDRITNYRKNGQEYTCALTIHPIFNTEGLLINYIAFEVDNNFSIPSEIPLMNITGKIQGESLSEDDDLNMFFRIVDYFRKEKPYLNPDLTQTEIANTLKTSPKTLSSIIRKHTNKNFSFFVNQFRVQEFQHILPSKRMSYLTLFAIAEHCGFKNKSTFHNVILNHTGYTPKKIAIQHKVAS